ncbi:hypothetical protein NP233_g12065 [Leucocoprinus birnbaumii]|uniref:F-box domain-containing protein n=1 Tax=Leucocoprinus birnbaumii TaxID=56174 RepID=A0AAD5VJ01_9AGAR|nr:hypothetical protein NP233_g12065 [Leucocoprinus birnbaumii]
MASTITGRGLLSLSNDVLLELFCLLTALEVTNCSLVCRRLYDLSFERNLWSRIFESGNHGYIVTLPPGVDPSTGARELRQVLTRAERYERSWIVSVKSNLSDDTLRPHPWHADHSSRKEGCAFVHNCIVFRNTIGRSQGFRDLIYTWYPIERSTNSPIEAVFKYTLRWIDRGPPYLRRHFFERGTRVIDDALHIVYGNTERANTGRLINLNAWVKSSHQDMERPLDVFYSGEIDWVDDEYFILTPSTPPTNIAAAFLVQRTTGLVVPIKSQHDSFKNGLQWHSDYAHRKHVFFATPLHLIHLINGRDYEIFKLTELHQDQGQSTSNGRKRSSLIPFQAGELPCWLHRLWHVQERSHSELTILGPTAIRPGGPFGLAIIRLNMNFSFASSSSLPPATIDNFRLCGDFPEEPRLELISANARYTTSQSMLMMLLFPSASTYHAVRVDFSPDVPEGQEVESVEFEPSKARRASRQFFWMNRLTGQFIMTCNKLMNGDAVYTIRAG